MREAAARALWAASVLLGTTLVAFVIAFVVPADPARVLAGPKADAETVAGIRQQLGLDAPLAVQYGRYLARLTRGDLGRSYVTRRPVLETLLERLPATLLLTAASLGWAVIAGVALGVGGALHAGRALDLSLLVGSVLALSVPIFWLGLVVLYVFGFRWAVLPLGGGPGLRHLILPAATLGVGFAAYYARLLHSSLVRVLRADYVRTARAKGLPEHRVVLRHALRNAVLPLVTVVSLDAAALLSGAVLTETVFSWPGMGRLAVDAVFHQDVPLLLGTVLVASAAVVTMNVLADLAYRWLDPRIAEVRG